MKEHRFFTFSTFLFMLSTLKEPLGLCTDQDLVALLKAGNEAAFAEIYDRYSMKIFHQVYHILQDREEAKDIVQELFLTIWNQPASLHESTNLGGYLYVAARNRVFKVIKKKKVRRDYLTAIAGFLTTISTDTMDNMQEAELRLLISTEIEQLPPKMKRIFELSRNENLSHKEISKKLNISSHTVKKQIHNALNILRLKLGSSLSSFLFL